MKDYNIFEPFVDALTFYTPNRRRKTDRIAFMGWKGDENRCAWNSSPNKSSFKTDAFILCMYEEYRQIEWKSVYRNTKGFHIKFHTKNIYLDLSDNQEVKILF